MAKISREANSQFLVTLSPTLMNAPTDVLPMRVGSFLKEYEADAAAAEIPAISCVAEYFAKGGNAEFLSPFDPYHLNGQGNTLVAQHIARWLRDHIIEPRRNSANDARPVGVAERVRFNRRVGPGDDRLPPVNRVGVAKRLVDPS